MMFRITNFWIALSLGQAFLQLVQRMYLTCNLKIFFRINRNAQIASSKIQILKKEKEKKLQIWHLQNIYQQIQLDLKVRQFQHVFILRCLQFFQKTNKNKSTWGIIVDRSNFFVRFLEELKTLKDILKLTDLYLHTLKGLYNITYLLWPPIWSISNQIIRFDPN